MILNYIANITNYLKTLNKSCTVKFNICAKHPICAKI